MIVSPDFTNLQRVRNQLPGRIHLQALQCRVKQITVLPGKLLLDGHALADFRKGSSNHSKWLVKPFVIK